MNSPLSLPAPKSASRAAVAERAFSALPIELKQLIRDAETTAVAAISNPGDETATKPQLSSNNPSLAAKLDLVEKKKRLELEHYLRVCSIRLFGPPSVFD